MKSHPIPPIVIMGVQGSGKSTIGAALASRLGVPFIDGDSLHPTANKEWMACGRALSDAQRLPWLQKVGERLASGAGTGIVVACSALKRSYRDVLRQQAPTLLTVFARGDLDLVYSRISVRRHEYMPKSLLRTQFDDLEAPGFDEPGLTVDITSTPEQIVDQVIAVIAQDASVRVDRTD
jgi:gluconokinase